MKVAAATALKIAVLAKSPPAASAEACVKAVASSPATVVWKMIYARLAGRKMRNPMENSKTPPSPPPPLPPPPSASAAATVTAPLPHENGQQKERPAPRRVRRPAQPVLRFTPYAWAKLLFFRDAGDTEIGGFGITRITGEDLLLVQDFVTVKQGDTAVTVAFDDDAVADFYEDQVDLGRRPEQFSRVWIHSHPGASASPS